MFSLWCIYWVGNLYANRIFMYFCIKSSIGAQDEVGWPKKCFKPYGDVFQSFKHCDYLAWRRERANLSAFHTFVRFVLVWICRFPLPLGVWEGLRFVIVALPGFFSYLFFYSTDRSKTVVPMLLTLCCFLIYSTRRFVLVLPSVIFSCIVLVFFSPSSIAITVPGKERAEFGAFCAFIRFALVLFCLFPLPIRVWDRLRLLIVALLELFSYFLLSQQIGHIFFLECIASDWTCILAGLPKGSILGPQLFLIYVNGIVAEIGSNIPIRWRYAYSLTILASTLLLKIILHLLFASIKTFLNSIWANNWLRTSIRLKPKHSWHLA